MAGGQSLIPLLKLRFSRPEMVVDLAHVPGLNSVKRADGHLAIGALVRHVDIERHRELGPLASLMNETAHWVADPLVRNRGTLAGSVCHADPAGDWGSALLALDATIVARSTGGERQLKADGFFTGPLTTTLRPDEVVTEVRIPVPKGRAGGAYMKLERKVGDFATVGVAVQVEMDGDRIGRAGIGLTAVGQHNIRAAAAERALAGKQATDEAFAEAGRLAAAAAEPNADIRGSVEYKKDVVRIFVQRALKTAVQRAREAKA
jgi:aerobic carbon-monoxide dehydrogenase medium subunit